MAQITTAMRLEQEPNDPSCLSLETMLRHVIQPEHMTQEQGEAVSQHVARCLRCARLYEAICDIDADLWAEAVQLAGAPVGRAQRTAGRQHRWPLVFHIGKIAAAACILIAIGVGWVMMYKGKLGRQVPITANDGSPAIFAELVTADGRKPLNLNQPITTNSQLQEIWLGGMHRVVMNRHTKATFTVEPQKTEGPHAGKVPYEIQLAQGELYVEVVPGNPFTVTTANARLEITGTQFDVLTDGDKTELTLLKGSVRFSALDRPQEAVSVTAGYTSTIVARLAPTAPAPTDAVATIAWAHEETLRNAIASSHDKDVDADLQAISAMGHGIWRHSSSADLDKLDYAKWRDEHRQNRLALGALTALPKDQAIKADWIEVLMVSGDIWQFHYDPNLPGNQPLTKLQPQIISRLAHHYGLHEKDILKALSLPESAFSATASVQDGRLGHQYTEALRRWHDAILATVETQNPKATGSLKTFSFNASQYLGETRIAAYLWVKNNPDKARQLLADKEYLAMLPTPPAVLVQNGVPDVNEWLKQLRNEATAAQNCFPAVIEWLTAPPLGCAQLTEQQRWLAELVAELMPSLEDRRQEGKGQ